MRGPVVEARQQFVVPGSAGRRVGDGAETVTGATGRAGIVAYLHAYVRHRGMLTVIGHQALADPEMRALHAEVHERPTRRHARFLTRLADRGEATLAVPAHALAEMVTGIAADDPDRLPELTDDLAAAYHRLTGLRS